jgi:hypothetical protein
MGGCDLLVGERDLLVGERHRPSQVRDAPRGNGNRPGTRRKIRETPSFARFSCRGTKQRNPAAHALGKKIDCVMSNYVTKSKRFQLEQKLLTNISAVLGAESLDAAGKKFDAVGVKALVQPRQDATSKVESLHLALQKALEDERTTLAASHDDFALVREALLLKYRTDPDKLGTLGLAPRKKRKNPRVETKAAAVSKAKATRAKHAPAPAPAAPTLAKPEAPPTTATPPAPTKANG